MAGIIVRHRDIDVVSVITRQSAEDMGLKVGDQVTAVIKSTEVMIARS